ncbi:hypothetical protein JNUCC0626_47920 [Lentzea sp. JNUCC 0626]|uniref:hypothetical protein n=1 Tax=Lentzea sp. JNUCC 0626 TaxID=3367513 RepID=UPI003747FC79
MRTHLGSPPIDSLSGPLRQRTCPGEPSSQPRSQQDKDDQADRRHFHSDGDLLRGTLVAVSPAQAASRTYNIMFVGTAIPANVGSVEVGALARQCVHNLVADKDRNSGISFNPIDDGRPHVLDFYLFSDSHCKSGHTSNRVTRNLPDGIKTKNWWVNLS